MRRSLITTALVAGTLLVPAPATARLAGHRHLRGLRRRRQRRRHLTNDFVELYNSGATPVVARRLVGPVRGAAGTELGSVTGRSPGDDRSPASTTSCTRPGRRHGDPCPTRTSPGTIAMAAGAGKVALVDQADRRCLQRRSDRVCAAEPR